ncbi:MAG: transposase [Phycisphaerales bacterium]|nr:transposase [Phycisphaerales bacterium]
MRLAIEIGPPGGWPSLPLLRHGRCRRDRGEHRRPILCEPVARRLLHEAIDNCRRSRPFELSAVVILPDHLHAIWQLPHGDADVSTRRSQIKSEFTRGWLASGGAEIGVSESRRQNRRRGVWQRRFWEHCLTDQYDFNRHLDYIHYNPVKHGDVACPHAWECSSFHRWAAADYYDRAWCCTCTANPTRPPDFKWAAPE